MNSNEHSRARQLIALGMGGDEAWLRSHLESCIACREYAAATGQAVRALHADPLAVDAELLQATKLRVRMRSAELGRQRERAWFVFAACLLVGLSSAFTTPLVWRAFAWLGTSTGISSSVWQTGFAFFWIAPALVVGVALLIRGYHLPYAREWN